MIFFLTKVFQPKYTFFFSTPPPIDHQSIQKKKLARKNNHFWLAGYFFQKPIFLAGNSRINARAIPRIAEYYFNIVIIIILFPHFLLHVTKNAAFGLKRHLLGFSLVQHKILAHRSIQYDTPLKGLYRLYRHPSPCQTIRLYRLYRTVSFVSSTSMTFSSSSRPL